MRRVQPGPIEHCVIEWQPPDPHRRHGSSKNGILHGAREAASLFCHLFQDGEVSWVPSLRDDVELVSHLAKNGVVDVLKV